MVLLLVLLSPFPSISVLSRVCRLLRFLKVSIEQLTQLALGVLSPGGQIHAIPGALVSVGGKAFAVAQL